MSENRAYQTSEQSIVEKLVTGVRHERKFGRVASVATGDAPIDLWEGKNIYPWDAANAAMYICSDNLNDTDIDIGVIGQLSDGTFADIGSEVEETITLQGRTVLPLQTQFLHTYRLYNKSTTKNISGTVYVFRGGSATDGTPDNSSDIRALINDGNNKTQMCVYPIPAEFVGFIDHIETNLNFVPGGPFSNNAAARVSIRVIKRGGVVRIMDKGIDLMAQGVSSYQDDLPYPIVVPSGGKVSLGIESLTTTMGFTGEFNILLKHQSLLTQEFLESINQPGY